MPDNDRSGRLDLLGLFISMIKPYEHQRKSIDEIFEKFQTKQKILYQLPTGGGKTIVFSFLTKEFIEKYNKRVLILCHRTELIEQTVKSLNHIGITCEGVTSKVRQLKHSSQCYVAMIETAYNRLKKNPYFFKDVGLIITDECHILIFEKVYNYFENTKILGCTATPVVLKRITFFKCKHCKTKYNELQECCHDEVIEWTRPFTMSEIYEDIVVGASIQDLIQDGKLVQEISFVKNYADLSNSKIDKDGEVIDSGEFDTDSAIFNVLLNYEELCKGKKTMIFNPSSKNNLLNYNSFINAGYENVRMFDSVNKDESGCRKEVVEWFRNTPDAILMNVGVFTTGFDVTDVEAIIMNRKTNSLSLFLQIVGRGGRSTTKIYKDSFIFIDGGGNIDRHNEWSDPTRDWKKIFFNGLSKEKEKAKKDDAEDIQTCENCGALFGKTLDICPYCDTEVEPKPPIEHKESDKVLQPIRKIPPPNGEKIYLYTLSQNQDLNFAWRILINQIVDMFRYYRVTKETFEKSLDTGEFTKKIKKLINPVYFVLKSKKDLRSGIERTIKYVYNKVLTKLKEYYERIN